MGPTQDTGDRGKIRSTGAEISPPIADEHAALMHGVLLPSSGRAHEVIASAPHDAVSEQRKLGQIAPAAQVRGGIISSFLNFPIVRDWRVRNDAVYRDKLLLIADKNLPLGDLHGTSDQVQQARARNYNITVDKFSQRAGTVAFGLAFSAGLIGGEILAASTGAGALATIGLSTLAVAFAATVGMQAAVETHNIVRRLAYFRNNADYQGGTAFRLYGVPRSNRRMTRPDPHDQPTSIAVGNYSWTNPSDLTGTMGTGNEKKRNADGTLT